MQSVHITGKSENNEPYDVHVTPCNVGQYLYVKSIFLEVVINRIKITFFKTKLFFLFLLGIHYLGSMSMSLKD